MARALLNFHFLFIFIVAANADFEQRCLDLTDGVNVKSYYFRQNCYVSDKTSKPGWDDALALCTHLKRPGYLAFLPGTVLVHKMFEEFTGHWDTWAGWIGLKRNGTAGSASDPTYFDWQGKGQIWHASEHATNWAAGYPHTSYTGLRCGHIYNNHPDQIFEYPCSSGNLNTILCQYRHYQLKFKKVFEGVRGSVNDTVVQSSVSHSLKCTKLCAATAVCQSYTYSQSQALCAVHMLPAEELPKEDLVDGEIYDLY